MAYLVYLITRRHKCMSSGLQIPNLVLYPLCHPHSLPSFWILYVYTYFLFVHVYIVHLLLPIYCTFTSSVWCYNLRLPSDWWFLWLWSKHVTNVFFFLIFLEEWKKEINIYFCSVIFKNSHTDCLYKDFEIKSF